MMIPLRRAFIVKQHGKLIYPEGTACAEVLVAGEKGGATAKMVFVGFGIALVHKFLGAAAYLWAANPVREALHRGRGHRREDRAQGRRPGRRTGPGADRRRLPDRPADRVPHDGRGGAVVLRRSAPAIATFGESQKEPLAPAKWDEKEPKDDKNPGLIRNMEPDGIKDNYVKFIGAGAVAAGGIISMCRALPLIFASIGAGLRDLRASRGRRRPAASRTEHDMPMTVVIYGSLALVLILAAVPQLGLGLNPFGLLGAALILLFGFLFVTVSSRLTGEVG